MTRSLSRHALIVVSVFALLISASSAPSIDGRRAGTEEGEKEGANSGLPRGPAVPSDWVLTQRFGTEGTFTPETWTTALREAAAIRSRSGATLSVAPSWESLGPTAIGGRIVDLALDPLTPNRVYIASASGGVWRSDDAGLTMQQAWPTDAVQAIGAIATGSDGTIYVGTGEANPGGGSTTYGGTGMYRSRDSGHTWTSIGLSLSGSIGRIAVHPTDPATVYVAAAGSVAAPGGERGLYKSVDSGDTWTLVRPTANDTTGAIDVAIDPTRPERVYVALWDRLRVPGNKRYGGMGSRAFRSTNGGASWTRLTNGFPTGSQGRIGLAVSPTQPDTIFAVVTATNGYENGFYASTNGGVTFTRRGNVGSQSSYGWWFGRVWVDPTNGAHLFAAGVTLQESFNEGQTWTPNAGSAPGSLVPVHADQHAMVWDQRVPGRVYLGNDGGLYRSQASGLGGVEWVHSAHMPFTQFYTMDVSQQDAEMIVGGAQDNGSLRSYVGAPPSPVRGAWSFYGLGDGMQNLINPVNPRLVYNCSQYGSCSRSTTGGDVMLSIGGTAGQRRNWLTPMEFDPSDPSIMYYGSEILNRSTDGGASWRAISGDLAPTNTPENTTYGTLTTIAAAPTDPNTIYVGSDNGYVSHTSDLGESWTTVSDPALPKRWVTRVRVSPTDEQIAYATFSGFGGEHVFRTTDGGTSWSSIDGNLPDAPVNDIVAIGDALVVATDVGVFTTSVTISGAPVWSAVGANLPQTAITDLRYQAQTQRLYIATFGRGIYRVAFAS